APGKRERRVDGAVAKLHASLRATSFRQKSNRVCTTTLQCSVLDTVDTALRLAQLKRRRAESIECCREHGVDKTLFQRDDHRARRSPSLAWGLDRLSRQRFCRWRAKEKDRDAGAK